MPNTANRVATHRDHAHCSVVNVCLPVAETNWVATKTLSCPAVLQHLGVQPSTHDLVLDRPTFAPHQRQHPDCVCSLMGVHLPMMPNRPLVRTVPLTATPSRPSAMAVWRIAALPVLCRLECRPTTSLRCPRFQNHGHDKKLPTGSVHGAHDVVGATVCTSEQDLPCTCRSETVGMALHNSRSFEILSSIFRWGAQHCDALRLPCLWTQVAHVVRHNAQLVPSLCLALMKLYACVSTMLQKHLEETLQTGWWAQQIHVIEKSTQQLSVFP